MENTLTDKIETTLKKTESFFDVIFIDCIRFHITVHKMKLQRKILYIYLNAYYTIERRS